MTGKSFKILIVDDEPQLLEISKAFLENLKGFEVETSLSAKDALKKMRKTAFDAIVSDYQMAETDGIELLQSIRLCNDPIPFILFTGKGREEVAIEALNYGADFYLQKGGDPKAQFAELANMIEQACARKQGERTLKISEERLRTYLDNAPEGIFIVDAKGNYQDVNNTACSMLKYSRDELLHLNIRDIIKKGGTQGAIRGFQQLKEKGKIVIETILVRKDGIDIPTFLNAVELPNQKYMAFCADITERKRAEYRLKTSEQRYRRLFETTRDGILILDFKSEMIIDANKFMLDIIGYSLNDTVGKNLWELGFIEDRSLAENAFSELRTNGYVRYENIPLRRQNGEIVPVEFVSNTYRVNGNKVIQCNVRDISERQLNDRRMKELASLVDSTYDAVIGKNLNGIVTSWNKGAERIYGYTKNEIVGRSISLLAAPDYNDDIKEILAKVSRGEFISNYETTRLTKDGRKINVSLMISPVLDDWGRIVGASTIASDVTNRKRAEEACRESETRFRELAEMLPVAVYETDQQGKLTFVNQKAFDMFGYTLQDLIRGTFALDMLMPHDREQGQRNIQKVMRGEDQGPKGYKAQRKDGSAFSVSIISSPILHDDKLAGMRGVVTDISEGNLADETLHASQKIIHDIINAIPVRVFWKDKNLVYLGCNAIFARDAGFADPKEIIGKDDYKMGWRDQAEKYRDDDRHVIESGCSKLLIEEPQKTPNGEIITLLTSKIPLRNSDGEIIGVLGTYMDITKRKRAEEALRESETRFDLMAEHAGTVVWEIDADGIFTYASRASEVVYGGYRADELIGKKYFYELTPEAERESFKATVFEMMKHMERFVNLENPIKTQDGQVRWVSTNGIPLLNGNGTLRGYQGSDTDITERKKIEQALNETNKKLNLLSNTTRHDINNQLLALKGQLALLKMKNPGSLYNEFALKAEIVTNRIAEMIKFTKEYEDVGVKTPIWHNVRELVQRESRVIALGAIELVNHIPSDLEVYADPLIAKVFHNLIDNAVRHGGKITTIHFSVEEHDNTLTIICKDDGFGIAPDLKKDLFMRDSKKKHGFGLFLSSEILSITDIAIEEKGEPGKGAKFVMIVPAYEFRVAKWESVRKPLIEQLSCGEASPNGVQ